ncbi:DUF4232 domain-containing protein [Streptomyces monashensis]|uniref:DUF4232 domain-containing protein n=1 Tax=Streptomyces monashensis TaxID=1678012 RepID=A0A1S2QQ49_9ACTN|nr:DUF4232 domain-containing protein [Streptomyces monashensis]OIK08280.1 hypothetical protein BIV23_00105 [Streptomyces monashensis]
MRVQKLSLLVVAAVAGLSLTACSGSDSGSSAKSDSSAPSQSTGSQDSGTQSTGGSGAATGKGTGTGTGTGQAGTNGGAVAGGGSGACKTAQLAFSTSGGMAEGELIVNLKNTGSATCALKGFPGADLKSKDGSISARRSSVAPVPVRVKPGEETRFTLHYPPNNSGGTGETFTTLVVTPPGETHSHSLPVGVNVPVTDGSGGAITVDPVGTGK